MTLQEMYDKVTASEELKKSFAEAAQDKEKLKEWLTANGSSATVEQVGEFLKAKQASGELSDDELEKVAGGKNCDKVVMSVTSLGMLCAFTAAASELSSSAGECLDYLENVVNSY